MVGVWDHLKDHCMKAYGPPQPSNPYKSPTMTRRQSRRVSDCVGQLYRWLGVKQAVMNYARTLHLLHGGVQGACSGRLEATSKSLTAFAVVLDQANKDLAAYGRGCIEG